MQGNPRLYFKMNHLHSPKRYFENFKRVSVLIKIGFKASHPAEFEMF